MAFYAVRNKQLELTPLKDRDKATSRQLRAGTLMNKHVAREQARKEVYTGRQQPQAAKRQGRFPVKENSNGYPAGFAQKEICGAMHHNSYQIAWFRDNESTLGDLVKSILPRFNQLSERKFAARSVLQKWLLAKMDETNPLDNFEAVGAFAVRHSCKKCHL